MKKWLQIFVIGAVAFAALPVLGHRSTRDLPDDQIYERIGSLVSSVYQADMDSQRMQDGAIMTTVSVSCVRRLEDLITDGLLGYASMLDGSVGVTIEFDGGGASLVITQK